MLVIVGQNSHIHVNKSVRSEVFCVSSKHTIGKYGRKELGFSPHRRK